MIRAWWNAQSARDRRVLLVGGSVVAILLVWALLWIPLSRARASLSAQVTQQRADLAWMRQSLAQAREVVERLAPELGSALNRPGRRACA